MLQQFAVSLTDTLMRQAIVKEEDREIYVYGFEALLSTLVNAVLIVAIGVFLGLIAETIVFLISFAILRVYSGGYHAKTHFGCISTFLVLYGLAMTATAFIPYQYAKVLSIIIGMLSLLFVFKYAPIEHKNRPILEDEFKYFHRMSRIVAIFEVSIIIIVFLLFSIKFALIISIAMLCVVFIMAFAIKIERKR